MWSWCVRFKRPPKMRNIHKLESALAAIAKEVSSLHDGPMISREAEVKVRLLRLPGSTVHWSVTIETLPGEIEHGIAFSCWVLGYLNQLWEIEDLQGVPKALHSMFDWKARPFEELSPEFLKRFPSWLRAPLRTRRSRVA